MVCANLREISRSFLRESLHLRILVGGVNAKKELFFLGFAVCDIHLRIPSLISVIRYGSLLFLVTLMISKFTNS